MGTLATTRLALIASTLGMILAAGTGCAPAGETTLSVGGNTVVLQRESDLSLEAVLFGLQAGSEVTSDPHFHAAMFYIPQDKARELAARHPDFYSCSSPAAAEAQSYVENALLFAAGSPARAELVSAASAFEVARNRIVLRLKGSVVSLKELRRGGQSVRMTGHATCFLVEKASFEERSR